MEFDGFDWDDGNRDKCRCHGVSIAAIESLFQTVVLVAPDISHSATEQRFRAVGLSGGRNVFVVFAWRVDRGRRLIRPISARFMHIKEVGSYEKKIP